MRAHAHGASVTAPMPRIDVLFQAPDVQIGEFWCPPGDPLWREENSIGAGWHVVFPGTGVLITHTGGRPIVANPNHAVFYDDGQTYRRELLSAEGDHCVFLLATAGLVRALYGSLGNPHRSESHRPLFAAPSGPIEARSYLLHRRIVGHLRAGVLEPLAAHEAAYSLLLRTVGAALREAAESGCRAGRLARRRSTEEEHRRLVDEAKTLLSMQFARPVQLGVLAGELHVSPFHLARVFRARTGWSIHRYLTDLRLRASLLRLPDEAGGLARLAADVGFSSHGHFTESFRRRFGAPPSALRDAFSGRTLSELRRNVEASPAILT